MTGPLGAIADATGVTFRAWAPKPRDVRLLLDGGEGPREVTMARDGETWESRAGGVGHGARYAYLLDGEGPFPDPCSRWQPDGVHGWSAVDDARGFAWHDASWRRPQMRDLVIYECHIGTMTPEGTFDSAIGELRRLAEIGITAIEIMPVAAFAGRWNWGYDGAALFAPFEGYGGPAGLRRLADAAHAAGLAVILDVVFNHFGPNGNYTGRFSDAYVTERHQTPWGAATNFDGPGSANVREFVFQNVLHWVREYHIDGFRFDATHAIRDSSKEHILAEVSRRLEEVLPVGQRPLLIAESHENDVRYLRPRAEGGFGFDAVWSDDFHHAMRTALTGESEGYMRGFDGSIDAVARTIEQGFRYEGQFDPGFGEQRGTPARQQPWFQFVYCLQNHDQVGNRAYGQRLNDTVGRRAMLAATMLLLLVPQTPLLFQGQEFLSAAPFLYFTDHDEELGRLVTEGRRNEFRSFRAFADESIRSHIPDPQAAETFLRSKLDLDRGRFGLGALAVEYHRKLIELRRTDPVLRAYRSDARPPIVASADGRALVVTLRIGDEWRAIAANFGAACQVELSADGEVVMHSDEGRFGGAGRAVAFAGARLSLPSECAAFVAGRG